MNIKREGNRWRKKKKKSRTPLFCPGHPHLWPFHRLPLPVFAKEDKCRDDSWPRKMLKHTTTICQCQPFQSVGLDTPFDALGPCLVASKTMCLWHSRRQFCKKKLGAAMQGLGVCQRKKKKLLFHTSNRGKWKLKPQNFIQQPIVNELHKNFFPSRKALKMLTRMQANDWMLCRAHFLRVEINVESFYQPESRRANVGGLLAIWPKCQPQPPSNFVKEWKPPGAFRSRPGTLTREKCD